MKECDKSFRVSLGKLYDDVLTEWRYNRELVLGGRDWMVIRPFDTFMNGKISDLMKEFVEKQFYTDKLSLFIQYIDSVFPKDISPYSISERIMKINFLSTVKSKIQNLIDSRKKEAKEKKIEKCMMDDLLYGATYLRGFMEDGKVRINTLRDNPNKNDYSKEDISIGSIVKINDGDERFWVKVTEIKNDFYSGTIANRLICDNGYDFGDKVIFHLSNIWDIEESKEEPEISAQIRCEKFGFWCGEEGSKKPEDTYKPGDRVFFIKQSIHRTHTNSHLMHLYLGIVKDWTVASSGMVNCTFDNAFIVMNLDSLDLDLEDYGDVKKLIEHMDFCKALIKSNSKSVCGDIGDIMLCVVDEKHFPKLNSIVAKAIKPKSYNPFEGQVFKVGIGWVPA